jgi:signal transduction histidine kinase
LRVENTLGYIELTVEHNKKLEETTNREGFKETPYYKNFREMLGSFVKFSGNVHEFLRRGWLAFKSVHHEETAKVKSETTAEDLSERIGEKLAQASQYHTSANNLKVLLTDKASADQESIDKFSKNLPKDFEGLAELKESVKSLGKHIVEADKLVGSIDTYLQEICKLEPEGKVLEDRFRHLREQLEQLYETASLGLTAEALSHEISNIADRLAGRCTDIRSYIKSQNKKDPRIFAFLEHVDTSIAALRKQLSHLAPSLKYVREKREKIEIYPFCRELAYFYRNSLKENNIDIQVTPKNEKNFYVYMNRGKLNQVFENLFLNSGYWLREDIRTRNIRQGRVNITIEKPFVRIFDNGRGVDPSVETTLFEPFIWGFSS